MGLSLIIVLIIAILATIFFYLQKKKQAAIIFSIISILIFAFTFNYFKPITIEIDSYSSAEIVYSDGKELVIENNQLLPLIENIKVRRALVDDTNLVTGVSRVYHLTIHRPMQGMVDLWFSDKGGHLTLGDGKLYKIVEGKALSKDILELAGK